jgi:mono/diheme cytochrome c family protein
VIKKMKKLFSYILPFAIASQLVSCSNDDPKKPGYEYMPDMYRSDAYEAHAMNPIFKDSMASRLPVEGTVARGNAIYTDADRMPYPYPNTPEGYEAAGTNIRNPLEKSADNLTEGKRLYENYCTHCHGATGQGDGLVVQNNGPKPPAYNSDQLKDLSEGKMFHSVHWGKNMMGSHASQLTPTQIWKIISYVQTLQRPAGSAATAAPADSTSNTSGKKS